DGHRPIESKRLANSFDVLCRGIRPSQYVGGVSRNEFQRSEDHNRDAEQHQQGRRKPADQKCPHCYNASGCQAPSQTLVNVYAHECGLTKPRTFLLNAFGCCEWRMYTRATSSFRIFSTCW